MAELLQFRTLITPHFRKMQIPRVFKRIMCSNQGPKLSLVYNEEKVQSYHP